MDATMLGLNGFANDSNWVLDAGRDYPRLAWEGTAGQIIPEPNIEWLDGNGTAEAPYLVDTADQLILLSRASALWDKHFVLGADIDFDRSLSKTPVFTQSPIQLFTGVFDGKDHTISHLTIKSVGSYVGLFGRLESGGEVKNLGVVDVNISGDGYVGGLVGWSQSGSVADCYSTGVVTAAGSDVGGLVGYNRGSVTRSYSMALVSGYEYVGGLVGGNSNSGTVSNSYSTGSVSASYDVGGLVGYNSGTVSNSYSTGVTARRPYYTGGSIIGGLVGKTYSSATVTRCFWDTQTSGKTTSSGGTGKTTAKMQTASTFLDAGWDFVGETANGTEDIWWINEGKDYPRLGWELFDNR